MELIMQEFSPERFIEIPEEVQAVYRAWRPTVLHRAFALEKALDTPAKIFYKYEGTSPAGSHKPNTAVAQAYYNKKEGVKRIATETGAGQWGSSLAMGCAFFGIDLKMYTLGHGFMPPPVHAGGLRYHGMAPIICHLLKLGLIEATAVPQLATFEAGVTFARTEGIISAPEANHAIRVTIEEALKCRQSGEAKTILLAHSGHGHFDMTAYESYLAGKLTDYEYPEEKVKEALDSLPKI
jgi:predicted alternative tryptophan synthase beta-subunit